MSGSLQAVIQGQIYAGYRQAAAVLGTTFAQYRATSAFNPTGPACFVQNLNAFFSVDPEFKSNGVTADGKADWWCLIDGRQTAVYDYIVGPPSEVPGSSNTWFISSQEPMKSVGVTRCNNIISVLRPAGNPGFGAQPYGGDATSTLVPIMTNWPAAILQGTKGEKGDSVLPGDVRMPWYAIQLPAFATAVIEAADVINDDLGRRYKISSCELTSSGWRLTAILAET
jgi:hypothetical protein